VLSHVVTDSYKRALNTDAVLSCCVLLIFQGFLRGLRDLIVRTLSFINEVYAITVCNISHRFMDNLCHYLCLWGGNGCL